MLEVRNVSKVFHEDDNFAVLENVTFSAKNGEFVCILGPSGCGKTVLLYVLASFFKASSGEVILDGKKVEKPQSDRVMIFQDLNLFPWLTVLENVFFGLGKSKISDKQKQKLAEKYIDLVDLGKFKNWYPCKLSGGMKQRVAIARALISDPKILLMDEPFSALDSQSRKMMRKNLEDIWKKTKKTIIFVTHSINEAIYLADTIYLFSGLPAKIKKIYKIDIPRPRDLHSKEFIEISRDIERELAAEFEKSFRENDTIEQALKSILQS